MSLEFQDVKKEAWRREQRLPPRVDYHCHISMIEYADIENPTLVSVTKEEFIPDLDDANIDITVIFI